MLVTDERAPFTTTKDSIEEVFITAEKRNIRKILFPHRFMV